MIIAIDGPSGAGKSTLGKRLAAELGLLYLDTGAMYRAAALAVLRQNVEIENTARSTKIVSEIKIDLSGTPSDLHVYLDGEDVSAQIRTPEVSQAASKISAIPRVRRILVERQKELGARGGGCVLEGRDIGTVVFPNADVKFFLTAEPESRASRRFSELREKHEDATFEQTLSEIIQRDERDATREDSPLRQAEDAIVIDSTRLDTEQVFEELLRIVRDKQKGISANRS